MDISVECDKFTGTAASEAIRGLLLNIQYLNSMRPHVQMGNLKFESLCHGVASSLQEIALRLVKMTDEDKENREMVLETRKKLLDAASNIVLNAKHPFKAFPYFDALSIACTDALVLAEAREAKRIHLASVSAMDSLDTLEKSSSVKALFGNVKIFGSKLHAFLELASASSRDLKCAKTKSAVVARVETVRKLLPLIVTSLRESLRHPMNSHTRSSKEFFFKTVKKCLHELSTLLQPEDPDNQEARSVIPTAEVGLFVKHLDSALEICEKIDSLTVFNDLNDCVEWLVKYGLSVAKACRTVEDNEIKTNCHNVIRETTHLKQILKDNGAEKDTAYTRDALREALEALEQSVNNGLLKLIVDAFCSVTSPLDDLIARILGSTVSPPNRLPEDVDDQVEAFDSQADSLFHLAHFTTFCTSDAKRATAIHVSLHLLQELEREVVPACLKLYFQPEDAGARAHLKAVRALWAGAIEQLSCDVMEIVDATAFCYVINEEVKAVAGMMKREQYRQDRRWIYLAGSKLIRMCERAVDLAFKDVSSNSAETALADDHPIVKVEKSIWELQSSLRSVLENVEDLNLHKTMIRRVQVLATSLGVMSHYLVSKNESQLSASKVRVLTSVSRITISKDSMKVITEEVDDANDGNAKTSPNGKKTNSRLSGQSFRSVRRKESLLRSRNETADVERLVNDSVAKLNAESSRLVPFITRKMAGHSTTGSKMQTGFDFTEIFNQLSAISHDISKTIEKDKAGNEVKKVVPKTPMKKHDVSLRQLAFKNAAATVGEPLKYYSEEISNNVVVINTSTVGVASPERLKDMKKLNEKLERIKTTL